MQKQLAELKAENDSLKDKQVEKYEESNEY